MLGDVTAVVGSATVQFWGSDWASQNVLSGGSAPNSFKGFASIISTNPPACGDNWTSTPGNSFDPPVSDLAFLRAMLTYLLDRACSWTRFRDLATRGLTL